VNPHRLLYAAAGLLIVLGAGAAVARAAGSPIGLWKAQTNNMYLWKAIPGGGFVEYSLTKHKTSSGRCVIEPNTNVWRYHPLGNGIYREDEFDWNKNCVPHWVSGYATLKIVATPTRMTLSCDKQYAKVCFSYTRAGADTVAPVVQALVSTGTVGGLTSLRYTVKDSSGKTWEELTLYRGSVIGRWKTTLGPSLAGHVYGYKLKGTPASAKGKLTFCVVSHDAAGNVSKKSCSTVTIT
jgi:hypothetical protein